MNDGFSWWLVVLGIAVGIGLVWLFTVRLPVSESDVDAEETVEEAGWISETIESWGGVAPAPLVQEVLELHKRYLAGDRSVTAADDAAADPTEDVAPDDSLAGVPEPSASDVHPADVPPAAVSRAAAVLPAAVSQATDAPSGAVSQATSVPPAFPPAGGYAEIPPPSLPRAEPE